MTPENLTKLCEEALEQDRCAAPPPWTAHPADPNKAWIASARTREPLLARALKGLLPYVEHKVQCNQWATELGEEVVRVSSRRCTCGLDSTLSALEGHQPKDT